MAVTLTYSKSVKGWPSFYSYVPEMMIGMNNYLYSFKGGNLWRHNTNDTRNNFYGQQYPSVIKGFVNDNPSDVKTFKTLSLESTHPWNVTVQTDLNSGFIQPEWFVKKEGDFFAHIRSTETNFSERAAQGIGKPSAVDSTDMSALSLTFSRPIGSMVSVGDIAYAMVNGEAVSLGAITSKADTLMIVNASSATVTPTTDTFILYVKNNLAESYGAKGYYMEYEITNNDTEFVELFAIGTSFFKSFP